MELHCDLSRAPFGVRKHLEDAEGMHPNTVKMMYNKRNQTNGDATMSNHHECSENRNTNGEVPMEGMHTEVPPSNEASKVKNSLHARQKSCTKIVKENGSQPKNGGRNRKSAQYFTDVGVRVRRRKKQNLEENHESNLRHQKGVESGRTKKGTRSNRPTNKRRQKQAPNAASERGRDQSSRTVKRTHEPDTLPSSNLPNGRGMKRSRRVAQRLAQEEPPPPPLKLPRLHIVLTRKEIQEDWIKITGHKYTGKPKKSTLIQKGLGLCTALTCPSSIDYLNDPH